MIEKVGEQARMFWIEGPFLEKIKARDSSLLNSSDFSLVKIDQSNLT